MTAVNNRSDQAVKPGRTALAPHCDPRGLLAWVRVYNLPDYSCYDMGFRLCAVS